MKLNYNKRIKIATHWLLSFGLLVTMTFLASCGGDDDPGPQLTDEQIAAQALANGSPWGGTGKVVINSTPENVDEVSVSELLDLSLNFDITGTDETIAPASFSASGAPNLFTTSGATWAWAGTGTSAISINGSNITQLTSFSISPDLENPTSITFSFTFDASSTGRTKRLNGDYTLTLEN